MQPFGCNSSIQFPLNRDTAQQGIHMGLLDLISLFGVRDGRSMSSYNGVMTYNMTEDIPRLGNGLSFCHWTYYVYLTMNVIQLDVYNYYIVNHPSHYHYTFIPSFFI